MKRWAGFGVIADNLTQHRQIPGTSEIASLHRCELTSPGDCLPGEFPFGGILILPLHGELTSAPESS
jgi:hypothetical protein